MCGIINKWLTQYVKNTMLDDLLNHITPHPCCSCGKIGAVLCQNCKNDIKNEYYEGCIICGRLLYANGCCQECSTSYKTTWCVGKRHDVLQRVIGCYKFNNMYAAHRVLAELLVDRIGELPPDVCIVPIPTAPSHIRERGYDHMACIAREMAKRTGCTYCPLLRRIGDTKQRGKNRSERIRQAKSAFAAKPCAGERILLIDDVVTTGATLEYATRALLSAGAQSVWVGVIAKQPLD